MKHRNILNIILSFICAATLILSGCGTGTGETPDVTGKVTYKLSFLSNGIVWKSLELEAGSAISSSEISSPSLEGYTFVSWDADIPSVMPENNIEINAVYKANSYTLTYTLSGASIKTMTYEYGAAIADYTPEYDSSEYHFGGWSGLPSSMPAHDLTVSGTLYKAGDIINIDLSSLSDGECFNITSSGVYMATGTAKNASLCFEAKDAEFTLILSGASISSSGAVPPIQCIKGASLTVILAESTVNKISDSSSNAEDAALQVKSADLTLSGSGSLEITAAKDGIYNTKNMTVSGGTIVISSGDHGIEIKNSLSVTGGSISITSAGDGIKTKGDTYKNDVYIEGSGSVTISGGRLEINASGDAVDAVSTVTVSAGEFVSDSEKDGIKAVSGITISGGSITSEAGEDGIKASGDSTLASSEANGFVKISGGTIKLTTIGDGIQAEGALTVDYPAVIEVTAGGGVNGTATYDENKEEVISKGLKGKLKLVINGGSITVNSRESALKSDNKIEMNGGSVNVKSAATAMKSENDDATSGEISISGGSLSLWTQKNGISAPGALSVSGGTLDITTTGTETKSGSSSYSSSQQPWGGGMGGMGGSNTKILSRGIKSDTSISISGGTVTVSSTGHAIKSNGTLDISGSSVLKLDAYYSGANSKGMTSDGTLTISNGTISITRSYEGIESKTYIVINGGHIELAASDDGINAGGTSSSNTGITINGGYIFANAAGDGIDSNGNINISGGTVLVAGPTDNGNGPLDCGDGNCYIKITGGTLLAYGSSGMAEYPSSNYSTQCSIGVSASLSSGSVWAITDKNGNVLFAFKALKSAQSVCLSLSELEKGSTYTVSTGGTYTGGECVNGVYSGGTYSGGSSSSLTLTSVTTSTGGGGMNPGGGGGRPGGKGW